MRMVNVHEAKTTLSRLLEEVEGGEQIIIARNGEPIAELRAVVKKTATERMSEFRASHGIKLDGLVLLDVIQEGRHH